MCSQAIRIAGLKKRFGRKQVLDGVGFSIPMGSVAGFLGPNGAGKTTTLRLLLGLIFPDEGEMELLGFPMPASRTAAFDRVRALVEQPAFIESFTGYENLYWYGSLMNPVSHERIIETLTRVGLSEAIHRPFGVYSTGMKQRLGVAAGILHRPSLLVLDEPTNGMDPQGRAHMREILKEIHDKEETTIFLSSHLLDEVQRLCDYVVIIDHGKTVREGMVSQLLDRGRETWEIRIPAEEISRILEFLGTFPDVLEKSAGPRGVEVTLKPGSSAFMNKALVGQGFTVSALVPHEASLEETFLAATEQEIMQ